MEVDARAGRLAPALGVNTFSTDGERTGGETLLWQRLDTPGHEVATIRRQPGGWFLSGVAIFAQAATPCRVAYEINCDTQWVRFPQLSVEVLEQSYTRLDGMRYRYGSAGGAFRRELATNAFGCVTEYPGLWHAEATASYDAPVA